MGYYNEFFIENEETGELIHVASSGGSDSPSYFDDVKDLWDWNVALKRLSEENSFWVPKDGHPHPFPWSTYKTSDNLLVLRRNKSRKWYNFWKQPKYEVWIDVPSPHIRDDNKDLFGRLISGNWGDTTQTEILQLPELIKKPKKSHRD